MVPVLTSAAIGAVVTRHSCLSLGRPSLRSIHACSLVAQVWPVRYRHKRWNHASASCPIAAAARCSDWPAGTSSAASSSAKPLVVATRSHCELAPNMRSCNSRPGPRTPPGRPPGRLGRPAGPPGKPPPPRGRPPGAPGRPPGCPLGAPRGHPTVTPPRPPMGPPGGMGGQGIVPATAIHRSLKPVRKKGKAKKEQDGRAP